MTSGDRLRKKVDGNGNRYDAIWHRTSLKIQDDGLAKH